MKSSNQKQLSEQPLKSSSEMNSLKLRAGKGDWYVLYRNGRVQFEGNKNDIKTKIKNITNYSDNKINDLLNQSLTDFIVIKENNNNLNKLEQLIENKIREIINNK
jgi:hypothetical protein